MVLTNVSKYISPDLTQGPLKLKSIRKKEEKAHRDFNPGYQAPKVCFSGYRPAYNCRKTFCRLFFNSSTVYIGPVLSGNYLITSHCSSDIDSSVCVQQKG